MAMNQTASETGIAVFARAPIPNHAKTRLIPLLGPERAAALQARLIEQAIATAVRAGLGPVSLWCAPDCEHLSFKDIERRYDVSLHTQEGIGLGARMARAFEVLTPHHPLLLMGTDCPAIAGPLLRDCARGLANSDLVFLPVEDGGYCLIGAKKFHPSLFNAIPWSTDSVMALTRGRAREAGLSFVEPALLFDIDRPQDYERALSAGLVENQ